MAALVEETPVLPPFREDNRPERSLERRRERERERSPPARGPRDERAGRDNRRGRIDERSDRRDRDRDYKRRKSTSPGYRDRRQSPSKRYDNSMDRGDRGDRGGRGDYNRGMGRGPNQGGPNQGPGFGGGGFPGRGSGFDILPGGTMPGDDSANRMGDVLLSYKQFMLELDDDVSPADALAKYEDYKTNFLQSQKKGFFVTHKGEEWLREKYDPVRLEPLHVKRKEYAVAAAKDFGEALQNGRLDLGAAAVPCQEEEEEDGDGEARRRRGGDRRGKEREEESAPKVPKAAAAEERVKSDLNRALALIKKLDEEKGVAGNVVTGMVEEEGGMGRVSISVKGKVVEGVELLDIVLTYLWRVHGADYYGGSEVASVPKGSRTVRENSEREEAGPKAGSGWEEKVDGFWVARLGGSGGDPVAKLVGKEKVEGVVQEALDSFVRKIRDEKYGWKYGCGSKSCTKLFHGPEFVYKHLKLKHPEIADDVTRRMQEEIYVDNYMSDPNAPVPDVTAARPGNPRGGVASDMRRPSQEVAMQTRMGDPGGRDRGRFERMPLEGGGLPPFAPYDHSHAMDGPYDREGAERGRFDRGPPRDRERPPPGDGIFERPRPNGPLERDMPSGGGGGGGGGGGSGGGGGGGRRDVHRRIGPLSGSGSGSRPGFDPDQMERGGGYERGPMDADMFDRGGPMEGERFGGEASIAGEGEGYGRGPMEDEDFRGGGPHDGDGFDPDFPQGGRGRGPPFDARMSFDGPMMAFDGPPHFGAGGAPPMLIPVPGAGPLGPFVPAPPEVAMRMMRERGGPPFFDGGFDPYDGYEGFEPPFDPPPFDGEGTEGGLMPDSRPKHSGGRGPWGGGGGRDGPMGRGRMGPGMVMGPPQLPMMMGMPRGVRADPRAVRSYRDLDAPDDEVTAIDYRSL